MEVTSAVVRKFVPVTIKLNTEVEVANLLGALIAYGTASVYAENALKAAGLGEFYSGNVRKAVRGMATEIAAAAELNTVGITNVFETYKASDKFFASKASKAGAKVIGTADDLAPGYEPTNFESGSDGEDSVIETGTDMPDFDDDYEY